MEIGNEVSKFLFDVPEVGRILRFNSGLAQIFGSTFAEWAGLGWCTRIEMRHEVLRSIKLFF